MGVLICPVVLGGCGFFVWRAVNAGKGSWLSVDAIVPSVAGVGIGAMWVFCWALLLLNRESLTIDRMTGEVRHREWWRLLGRERVKTYLLDRVAGVSLEQQTKAAAGGRRAGGRTVVRQTRLLLERPRRAITLASSESGWDREVLPTARGVSEWMRVELTLLGETEELEAILARGKAHDETQNS